MGLPGDIRKLGKDSTACCERHEDRKATHQLCTESDSFGDEWTDVCDECITDSLEAPAYVGVCEWCKTEDVELSPVRDTDEGTHGPLYDVCNPCKGKQADRDAAEWNAMQQEMEDEEFE